MRALSPKWSRKLSRHLVYAILGLSTALCSVTLWGQSSSQPTTLTPFERYGKLSVVGTELRDRNGKQVQLKGICLFDTTSYGELANPSSLRFLRDDWGIDILRAAMYTEYNGKFIGEGAFSKIEAVVESAIQAGLYVIIDWHILTDGDPRKHAGEAKDFFARMSAKFKDYPNVLYEICNEPNGAGVTWKDSIRPYAMELVPIIRANAPDSLILVGNSTWSQDVDASANDPLPFKNILYVLHFYAGTHFQQLRDRASYAVSKGLPLFVSEFGTSKASGSGGVYPAETITWLRFLNEKKISYINWSLTTKLETSAAVKPGVNPNGPWPVTDLTESGLLVRSIFRNEIDGPVFADGFETGNFRAGNWQRDSAGIGRTQVFAGTTDVTFEETASLAKDFDTSIYKDVKLSFAWRSEGTKNMDKLSVEWFDGTAWKLLQSISISTGWSVERLELPPEAAGIKTFKFRFAAAIKTPGAKIHIDDVILSAKRPEL